MSDLLKESSVLIWPSRLSQNLAHCEVRYGESRCRLVQTQIMGNGQWLVGMCTIHAVAAEKGCVDSELNECDPGRQLWSRRPSIRQ